MHVPSDSFCIDEDLAHFDFPAKFGKKALKSIYCTELTKNTMEWSSCFCCKLYFLYKLWLITLFCIFFRAVWYHDLQVMLFVILYLLIRNRSNWEQILRFPSSLKNHEGNAVVWWFTIQVQVLFNHLN